MDKGLKKRIEKNIMRIAIISIILLSITTPKNIHAEPIVADGPFQVAVTLSSITPSPSFIHQPVTITILVESIDPLGGIPDGEVEVKSGTELVCEITLNASGGGSCILQFDNPAYIPLQAFYTGTDRYLPAASTAYTHQVMNKYNPLVKITADTPDPSIINRLVHVGAQVSSTWQEIPTGLVTVFRSPQSVCQIGDAASAVDQCSFSLNAQGEGACNLLFGQAGDFSICAYYPGDTAHFEAISAVEPHAVSLSNSFIDLVSVIPSPSVLNETISVNFQVKSPDGVPQNGLVTIYSGETEMCSTPVTDGSCSFPLNSANEHILYATYSGEIVNEVFLHPSVSNPVSHFVNAPPVTISLDNLKIDAFRDRQTTVAKISATDPNPDDEFAFQLINGEGDEDNKYFSVLGNGLIALGNIPYEDGRLSIRLRATDPSGLFLEEVFQISLRNNLPELPNTGFTQNQLSLRPMFSFAYQTYQYVGIQIPKLAVNTNVVGVPMKSNGWDTSWLGANAGWLNGSAFPGWGGNSVIAAHNFLPTGQPGPFAALETLQWGDTITIQVYGTTLHYEVRSVNWVAPNQNQVLSHLDGNWLTLITCDQYDEQTEQYRWRIVVKAVLTQAD